MFWLQCAYALLNSDRDDVSSFGRFITGETSKIKHMLHLPT